MKNKKRLFRKWILTCVIFSISWINIVGQDTTKTDSLLHKEILFAKYLYDNALYKETITVLNKLNSNKPPLQDSISFLKGLAHLNCKNYDLGIAELDKITKQSILYTKAGFINSFHNANQSNYEQSIEKLKELQTNTEYSDLANHYYMANLLLSRKTDFFFNELKNLTNKTPEINNLSDYALKIKNFDPKSRWIAGLFSAIIPGTGKIYASETGSGFSSLLLNLTLAFLTLENYKQEGKNNYKTIFFGSMFTVFYLGNIYGSVVSIKTYREKFNYEINSHILLDMAIPLQQLYR